MERTLPKSHSLASPRQVIKINLFTLFKPTLEIIFISRIIEVCDNFNGKARCFGIGAKSYHPYKPLFVKGFPDNRSPPDARAPLFLCGSYGRHLIVLATEAETDDQNQNQEKNEIFFHLNTSFANSRLKQDTWRCIISPYEKRK